MKTLSIIVWSGFFICCAASATIRYVDVNSTNPVAPYNSWDTAATSIQPAVNAAAAGDTVLVADGHYQLSSQINVSKALTIQSVNGPAVTTVDGGGVTRCFHFPNGGCEISGFTITNGYTLGHGGGIYCPQVGKDKVSNCIISGNTARYNGGGMYDGVAYNCIISGNSADNGGGIYSRGGFLVASNCVISGNTAVMGSTPGHAFHGTGGGMFHGIAERCFIGGNSAAEEGGGTFASSSLNCTISGNSAAEEGGGYLKVAQLTARSAEIQPGSLVEDYPVQVQGIAR